jgi:hypothetical protein
LGFTFEDEIHGLLSSQIRTVPNMQILRRNAQRRNGFAGLDEIRVVVRSNERAAEIGEGTVRRVRVQRSRAARRKAEDGIGNFNYMR